MSNKNEVKRIQNIYTEVLETSTKKMEAFLKKMDIFMQSEHLVQTIIWQMELTRIGE